MHRSLFIGALLFASVSHLTRAQEIAPGTFDQMDLDARVALVLAGLQERDARLQNFQYAATEVSTNIGTRDPAVRKVVKGPQEFAIKRKGGAHRLDLTRRDVSGKVKATFAASWRGREGRSLTLSAGESVPTGMIRDQENENFSDLAYNYILGFRALVDEPATSLTGYIEASVAKGSGIEVSRRERDGRNVIVLTVTEGVERRTFALDPTRNFMPVEISYRSEQLDQYNKSTMVVQAAEERDGLWVPTKVLRRTGTSAMPDFESEAVYEISSFSVGTVTDAEIDVEHPAGTRVLDRIRKVAYTVLPSGEKEFVPLYDPATGQVLDPSLPKVSESVAQSLDAPAAQIPAAAAAGVEMVPAAAPAVHPRPPQRALWVRWGMRIAAVVALSVSALVAARLWRRARA